MSTAVYIGLGFCLGGLAGLSVAGVILAGLGRRISAMERDIAAEKGSA